MFAVPGHVVSRTWRRRVDIWSGVAYLNTCRVPEHVSPTCMRARLPTIIEMHSSILSRCPMLAWVDRREARVISRLPLRPSSAGTMMNSSVIWTNTSQCCGNTRKQSGHHDEQLCNLNEHVPVLWEHKRTVMAPRWTALWSERTHLSVVGTKQNSQAAWWTAQWFERTHRRTVKSQENTHGHHSEYRVHLTIYR